MARYIERSEALRIATKYHDLMLAYELAELPTVDVPERNVGKWIKVGDNSYRCSVCNEISCCNGNFCPDCGADMRKETEDASGT